MNLIFLGPPGAGKGTQAQMVCNTLGIPQISTGDMLRSAIAQQTETGMKAKAYMDNGQLVPDDVVIAIVKERLCQSDCRKGYLLDGFPRTVYQAEALDSFAKIDKVVNLQVDDDVLVDRLGGRRVCPKCGAPYHVSMLNGMTTCINDGETLIHRDDDQPETILNRLKVYHEKTAPLITYYQNAGKLCNVAGDGDKDEIGKAILASVEA